MEVEGCAFLKVSLDPGREVIDPGNLWGEQLQPSEQDGPHLMRKALLPEGTGMGVAELVLMSTTGAAMKISSAARAGEQVTSGLSQG